MCHTLLSISYLCLFSRPFCCFYLWLIIGWSVFHPASPVFLCLFAGPCVPDLFLVVLWSFVFVLLFPFLDSSWWLFVASFVGTCLYLLLAFWIFWLQLSVLKLTFCFLTCLSLFLHLGPFLMSCDPNNKWNEDLNLNGVFLCLVNTSKIYFKRSHDIMTHKGIHFSCTCLFSCECGWPHFVHYQGPPYHSYWACKGHELVFNVNSGSSQGQRGWGWCVLHCSATYH